MIGDRSSWRRTENARERKNERIIIFFHRFLLLNRLFQLSFILYMLCSNINLLYHSVSHCSNKAMKRLSEGKEKRELGEKEINRFWITSIHTTDYTSANGEGSRKKFALAIHTRKMKSKCQLQAPSLYVSIFLLCAPPSTQPTFFSCFFLFRSRFM